MRIYFCPFQLILEYLKHKLDTVSDNCYQLVARLLVDMVIMSYRFENDLNPKRGIGKILDLVKPTSDGCVERNFIYRSFLISDL